MLTGRFVEAGQDEIPFINNEFTALLIVLYIAHLKVHKVPRYLTLYQLVKVATVCERMGEAISLRRYCRFDKELERGSSGEKWRSLRETSFLKDQLSGTEGRKEDGNSIFSQSVH
jgi:hypothetical protein